MIRVERPVLDAVRATASLSRAGQLVCSLHADTDVHAAAADWVLSSKACDFIDAWFGSPATEDLASRELLLHPFRSRRRRVRRK